MITDWNKMIEVGTDFNQEFNLTKYGITNTRPLRTRVLECVKLDKAIKIYTGQDLGVIFEDRGNEYYIYFGQGQQFPKEKEGLAWLSDSQSIFFFERPYTGKVVRLLKQLLPEHSVEYYKNDIYIDGTKNGASLRTGYQSQMDDYVEDLRVDSSAELSGMIYILRWSDIDELNEVFKDIEHHQIRLRDKKPLSTLSDYITNMTREQFMQMLEDSTI